MLRSVLLVPVTVIVIALVVVSPVVIVDGGTRTVNNLIKLAAIQPDAAALRAVVDFHALPVGHF